jgi:hypothetical protein
MELIPPETLIGLIVTAFGLFFAALGGAGYLFRRWFLGRLETERARNQQEIEAAKSKVDLDRLEIQNQLDQTQSSREMLRLQMSESSENRKAFLSLLETMRGDAIQRDSQHAKHLSEITESFKGIQSNTAATFGLLKEMVEKLSRHQESDEIMEIKQDRIIAQNESTHSKMADMGSLLAEIALKLEGITVGRASDRKIIEEIHEQVLSMQQSLSHIEESAKAPPQTVVTATQPATSVTKSTEETQSKEEKE